jgi:hypothetical protein
MDARAPSLPVWPRHASQRARIAPSLGVERIAGLWERDVVHVRYGSRRARRIDVHYAHCSGRDLAHHSVHLSPYDAALMREAAEVGALVLNGYGILLHVIISVLGFEVRGEVERRP